MQSYLDELCNDSELVKALKISSLSNLFVQNNAKPMLNFYKSFSRSWCADLKTALEKYPNVLSRYLETIADQSLDFRTIVLYIAQGDDAKINLAEFVDNELMLKVIVIVSSNSCLDLGVTGTVISTVISINLYVEPHASVQLSLQDADQSDSDFLTHVSVYLDAYATVAVHQYQTFGRKFYFFDYYLQQANASIKHQSFGALTNTMYQAIITRQFHQAEYTSSDVLIKTVLDGASRSFYRGTIAIKPEGRHAVSQQQHKGLLVDQRAYTCGIPSLEVETNEVRCTHGTAASSLDDQLIWYLQSRGLSNIQARQLLIRSFLNISNQQTAELENTILVAQQRLQD